MKQIISTVLASIMAVLALDSTIVTADELALRAVAMHPLAPCRRHLWTQ